MFCQVGLQLRHNNVVYFEDSHLYRDVPYIFRYYADSDFISAWICSFYITSLAEIRGEGVTMRFYQIAVGEKGVNLSRQKPNPG